MKKRDNNPVGKPLYFSKAYDFFAKYMHTQKSASLHTILAYKAGLTALGTYTEEVMKIPLKAFYFENITYDFMLDFRNYLHETRNLSVSTCNNRLAANKTYLEYCAARDISLQPMLFAVSQVPFYNIPKVHQPIIENEDALAALLNAPLNTDKGIRDKAILSFLYDGGLRVDELVKLTYGDVDVSNVKTNLTIHGKGAKERVVILDEKVTALCHQFRNVFHRSSNPLCPFFYTSIGGRKKEMTTRNVRELVYKYADQVRTDYSLPAKVSPHTLRRTRGTMLYRDGVPLEIIAKAFGHANVEVTRAHYAFESEDQMLDVARKYTHVIPEGDTNVHTDEQPLYPENVEELKKLLGF